MVSLLEMLQKARQSNDKNQNATTLFRLSRDAVQRPSVEPGLRAMQDMALRITFEAAEIIEAWLYPVRRPISIHLCAKAAYHTSVYGVATLNSASMLCESYLARARALLIQSATPLQRLEAYDIIETRHHIQEQVYPCYVGHYGGRP